MKQLLARIKYLSQKLRKPSFQPKPRTPPVIGAKPSLRSQAKTLPAILKNPLIQNCFMIIACAYFVADFVATAIRPMIPEIKAPRNIIAVEDKRKQIVEYDPILNRNLFNEKGLIPDTDEMNSGYGPPVKSSLNLNLMGVIVVQDELKSVASVEDKGANQVIAVRVNDYINPDAMVQKIELDRLIFFNRSSNRREFIELPQDQIIATARPKPSVGAGIQKEGERYTIPRATLDKTLSNINEVLTQARCVPNFDNGRPDGYRCFQIAPGSIYQQLGMEENDVICGINGEPITDPAKAFTLFSQLPTMSSAEICIKRNGRVITKNYDFR